MAFVAPIHRPSSVRHALQVKLLSADEQNLVLAKSNRLEIYKISDGRLSLLYTRLLHGRIVMLQKLRPKDAALDLLLVGTDRFQYFTAGWKHETAQLETKDAFEDPGERLMRDAASQDRCIVDPSGTFVAMHLWEGVLSLFRLGHRRPSTSTINYLDQIRLQELFIRTSTFLYTETGHPKIAFLYQSSADSEDAKLATYRITSDDRNLVPSRFDPTRDREFHMEIPDPGASMLIPVRKVEEEVKRHHVRNPESAKAQLGGLIVVGETRLRYIDEVTKTVVESALDEASIFVAWAEYDAENYFLADDYGNMHMLVMETDGVVVKGMRVVKLGETSRASNLVYLGDGLLFVASHYGDSQLYRFNPEEEDPLELVQVLPNIGPILDFAIMDMGNRESDRQPGNQYSSGQARIVTGSGVHKDGTLRSVRSGVGLEDVGVLCDSANIRRLFSIRSRGSTKVDTLLASFLTETRVFRFDPTGEIEEVRSFAGMHLDEETLLAANVPQGRLLQVTAGCVSMYDMETGVRTASWMDPDENPITAASANDDRLLLAVGGNTLVLLQLRKGLPGASILKVIKAGEQIACVHVAPQLPNVGVVGFWASGVVSTIDLDTLEPIHGMSLRRTKDDTSIPRDLALIQALPPAVSGLTLFIAMEDGNVVTFNISKDYAFSGRKNVRLGTTEARFHLLPQPQGVYSILATTENPSLIYGLEGRIIYSAVTAEDATCVCPFDTEAFGGCIAVATKSQLKISRIDNQRRTHVKSLPMGKTIRRIAYSPTEKLFGLGCIRRELIHGEEIVQSSFELVDEIVFDTVGKPFPLHTASYTEMVEAVIRAKLRDSYGYMAERFIVGTSFLEDPDFEGSGNVRGRIMIFGIDSDRNPYLITKQELKGGCRCLAVMDDKIVAGLTKTVVVSRYKESSTTTAVLDRLASYRPSTYPVDLTVEGNIIAVADLMKSITLVEYRGREDDGTSELVELARHYQSAWATAVAHVEGDSWLEADAQGNLVVLRRNSEGVTKDDEHRMEVTCEFNLGEQVNKVRKVNVEMGKNAMILPKAFLGTVEGGIYLFGTIARAHQDLLLRFQNRMSDVVKTTGELDFRAYRAFMNEEREGDGPFRFLDGELLERFLDVDEAVQTEICHGLGPSVEEMRNMVEELRRMH